MIRLRSSLGYKVHFHQYAPKALWHIAAPLLPRDGAVLSKRQRFALPVVRKPLCIAELHWDISGDACDKIHVGICAPARFSGPG